MRRVREENPNTSEYWNYTAIADGFLTNYLVDREEIGKLLSNDCIGSILDVGAGSGMITKYLRGDVTACDYSKPAVEHLKKIFKKAFWCDLTKGINKPDESYDTVVATEILEHFDDYEAVVKELKRLAKWRVIITTPNDQYSFRSREHVWAFTEDDIKGLGFKTTIISSGATIYGVHNRRG